MKTVNVEETVKNITPPVLANLPDDAEYRLTKIYSSRTGYIDVGDSVTGHLSIVEVEDLGKPGVLVNRGFRDRIRTSPIVSIVKVEDNTIDFQTEGGVYRLEKLPSA